MQIYLSRILIISIFNHHSCIVCLNSISIRLLNFVYASIGIYWPIQNIKIWVLTLKFSKTDEREEKKSKFKTKDLDELAVFWTQMSFESENWLNTAQNIFQISISISNIRNQFIFHVHERSVLPGKDFDAYQALGIQRDNKVRNLKSAAVYRMMERKIFTSTVVPDVRLVRFIIFSLAINVIFFLSKLFGRSSEALHLFEGFPFFIFPNEKSTKLNYRWADSFQVIFGSLSSFSLQTINSQYLIDTTFKHSRKQIKLTMNDNESKQSK